MKKNTLNDTLAAVDGKLEFSQLGNERTQVDLFFTDRGGRRLHARFECSRSLLNDDDAAEVALKMAIADILKESMT